MCLARSSPTVLTWFMDASSSGLQRPHSGTPRPPGASTPSGPAGVVGRPVRDLVLLSRNMMAAVLVYLERHDRDPGAGQGERGALLRYSAPQHQPTDPCTTLSWLAFTSPPLSSGSIEDTP